MTSTLHEPGYDIRTSQTEHGFLAAAMYGEEFLAPAMGPILNVAAGNTDLAYDLRAHGFGVKDVVSLDPMYAANGLYANKPDRVAGLAKDIPYPNESFAATLCQFGLQHMKDPAAAIREMIRVTASVGSVYDNSRGTILLNPVFGSRRLVGAIFASGLQDVCGIQDPPLGVENPAARPTLVIKKIPALDEAKIDTLVAAIMTTRSMQAPRRSLGEMVSRAFHGASGF